MRVSRCLANESIFEFPDVFSNLRDIKVQESESPEASGRLCRQRRDERQVSNKAAPRANVFTLTSRGTYSTVGPLLIFFCFTDKNDCFRSLFPTQREQEEDYKRGNSFCCKEKNYSASSIPWNVKSFPLINEKKIIHFTIILIQNPLIFFANLSNFGFQFPSQIKLSSLPKRFTICTSAILSKELTNYLNLLAKHLV